MPSFRQYFCRTVFLSPIPCKQGTFSFLARAATTGFFSVERISAGIPSWRKRSKASPSARLQSTASRPSSKTSTRLSVSTPSKSKTMSLGVILFGFMAWLKNGRFGLKGPLRNHSQVFSVGVFFSEPFHFQRRRGNRIADQSGLFENPAQLADGTPAK